MNPDEDNELKAIFDAYHKDLPNKIKELVDSLNEILNNWDNTTYNNFYSKVHKLHGSAGVYGYQQISLLAGKLEAFLGNFEYDIKPTPDDLNKIKNLVNDISATTNKREELIPTVISTHNIQDDTLIYLFTDNIPLTTSLINQAKVFGYRITAFASIDTLFAELEKQNPLAILVDFDLLENPFEVSLGDARVSNLINTYFKKSLTLFFANHADFERRLKALRMGSKGFILTPFNIDELVMQFDNIKSLIKNTFRAIIIDDEPAVSSIYSQILTEAKIENRVFTSPKNIESELHQFAPDILLLDLNMPLCSGVEIATVIRQQKQYEDIPIIFLSTEENRDKQIMAMASGADDFISKSSDHTQLIQIIRNKANRYRQIKSLLVKDNLTGAFNFRHISREIERIIHKTDTQKIPLSIAIVKIDNLASINNTYGYSAVDQVLKGLYVLLNSQLDSSDTIGHYSQDEFIIIMPNTSAEQAQVKMATLSRKYQATLQYHNGKAFNATFSFGIASYKDKQTISDFIEGAHNQLSTK